MKLTLDRDVALTAVARAAAICARTNTIPILGHVVIEAGKGRATFRATNLETEIVSTIEAEVAVDGSAALPVHTFVEALKSMASGAELSIVVDHQDPRAIVRGGRSTFKLPILPSDWLPRFVVADALFDAPMPGKSSLALATVVHAAAQNDVRPGLNAVCFTAERGKVRAYATNQHRAAAAEADIDDGPSWRCMLQPRTADLIADMAEGAERVSVRLSESLIEIVAGDVRLTSKLLDVPAPNYERAFGADLPHTATADRQALIAAVRRALIVNTEKERSVRLDFSADSISVSTLKAGAGEATDQAEAQYDGPDAYVIVNGGYVLDALTRIAGPSVSIRLKDNNLPLIVTDRADPSARFMVGVQHG